MRRELILRGGRALRYGAAAPQPRDVRIGRDGRIADIGPRFPPTTIWPPPARWSGR